MNVIIYTQDGVVCCVQSDEEDMRYRMINLDDKPCISDIYQRDDIIHVNFRDREELEQYAKDNL